MGKINYGRVVLGGIGGGIVAFLLDVVVNVLLLGQQWLDANKALNHTGGSLGAFFVIWFLVWIVGGVFVAWVYAAIRPRFGAGLRTAVYAGLVIWILGIALPGTLQMANGIFPRRLELYSTLGGIITMVACAVVGAWLYKEEATAAYPAAAPQATR